MCTSHLIIQFDYTNSSKEGTLPSWRRLVGAMDSGRIQKHIYMSFLGGFTLMNIMRTDGQTTASAAAVPLYGVIYEVSEMLLVSGLGCF